MLQRLGIVLMAGLLSCDGGEEVVASPSQATPEPPVAAPALPAILGTWHLLTENNGQMVSMDPCDADRMGIELSTRKLTLNYSQDGEALVDFTERTEGPELVLDGSLEHNPEQHRVYRLHWGEAGRLLLDGEHGSWQLAKREQIPDEQFLVGCCREIEGMMPEEYAMIPHGRACPPDPEPPQ